MRKLIMWNIITLDGFFEGEKPWELPFHLVIWGDELERLSITQLKGADCLVFGRLTYEGMAAHWTNTSGEIADLMNAIPKIVVSRTMKEAGWNNTTIVRDDVAAEIRKMKQQGDRDMYVFGSANLCETLVKEDLFDEYRIGIAPVILGSGRPLFGRNTGQKNLRLLSSDPLTNGGIVLRYGV